MGLCFLSHYVDYGESQEGDTIGGFDTLERAFSPPFARLSGKESGRTGDVVVGG